MVHILMPSLSSCLTARPGRAQAAGRHRTFGLLTWAVLLALVVTGSGRPGSPPWRRGPARGGGSGGDPESARVRSASPERGWHAALGSGASPAAPNTAS